MKALSVRFSDETKAKIEQVSRFNETKVSNSTTARAAMNYGLEMLEVAKLSMAPDEYRRFLIKLENSIFD